MINYQNFTQNYNLELQTNVINKIKKCYIPPNITHLSHDLRPDTLKRIKIFVVLKCHLTEFIQIGKNIFILKTEAKIPRLTFVCCSQVPIGDVAATTL